MNCWPLALPCAAPVTLTIADKVGALADLEALAIDTAKKARGLFSPLKIIECAKAAVNLPFEQGLAHERALFVQCLESPQRQGLIHAFFAEREVTKIPEAKAAAPRAFAKLAIIGGGTMGAGITVSALDAGFTVTMIERDAESIARGQANVEKVYNGLIAKGRMTEEGKAAVMARYTPSTSYDDIADVDLVIEAVFEDLEVKKAVFKELDRVCKPGAVLATNTSYLDIDAIANATSRPQDVIGLHFFSPANIMKLLEIVVPAKVSADVVATAFELAKKMKKVPVRAGVCDGFIGNRILAVYKQAADYLMEDGAIALRNRRSRARLWLCHGPLPGHRPGRWRHWLGHPQAPRCHAQPRWPRYVEDCRPHLRKRLVRPEDRPRFLPLPARCPRGPARPRSAGDCGCRARQEGRNTTPVHDRKKSCAATWPPWSTKVPRWWSEGIALRPLDVDVTFISGYGFPRYRGGPMKWADMQGLDKVLADIKAFDQGRPAVLEARSSCCKSWWPKARTSTA